MTVSPRSRRRGLRYRSKLTLAVSGVALGVVLVAGLLLMRVARAEMIHELSHEMLAVVNTGAPAIDGDEFAKLTDPAQMGSPAYRRIQSHLRAMRQVNPEASIHFLYTLRPGGKPHEWVYVVDSEEPDSPDFSPLGKRDTYDDSPELDQAMHHEVMVGRLTKHERWGTLLTVGTPIRNKAGQAVGVLALDASLDAVHATTARLGGTAGWCGLLALSMALIAALLFSAALIRPINALRTATRAVADGDLEQCVNLPGRDELAELADAFNAMTSGLRERELYKQQFERYVSRQVAQMILSSPAQPFWNGEMRHATVVFVDIRGFTAMSETMPPAKMLAKLNEYFEVMIEIIFAHDGTLDKFIGDGIMALFGAPISLGNDEERAVRAALALVEASETLSRRWVAAGDAPLRIGVGINTGEVVVGNIGSDRRLEWSAIGDTVNVASRLEGLNKVHATQILISASTYEAVAPLFEVRAVGHVPVYGRADEVEVYEVLGLREPTQEG